MELIGYRLDNIGRGISVSEGRFLESGSEGRDDWEEGNCRSSFFFDDSSSLKLPCSI
jgi:hypothetical protein